MKFVDTVKHIMATYPSVNENVFDVYNHMFLTIGNGFDWVDGELVSDTLSKTSSISCTDKLLTNLISRIKNISGLKESLRNNLIDKTFENYKNILSAITQIENSICNMSIPTESPFVFDDLNECSALANLPENVKSDWLYAAKRFVDLIKSHKDLIKDDSNLLDKIDERISNLYKFSYENVNKYISYVVNELEFDRLASLNDFFIFKNCLLPLNEESDNIEYLLHSDSMKSTVTAWAKQNNTSEDSIIKFILDNKFSYAELNISLDTSYDNPPKLSNPTVSNPNGTLLKECKFICSISVNDHTFNLKDLYFDCERC